MHAQATEGDAKSILKGMSDYLSAERTIAFRFNSDIEIITPELEKIQFASSGEALVNRPNKLHANRIGGYSDVELFFDGTTASVFGSNIDGYTQFGLPGTVDYLVEALRAGHGVALPGADLLLSDPYSALVAGVLESKHIGMGVIGCRGIAFWRPLTR